MENEKQTRQKLIDSAKKEFLEKGYSKASLRSICADAGVNTGVEKGQMCVIQGTSGSHITEPGDVFIQKKRAVNHSTL